MGALRRDRKTVQMGVVKPWRRDRDSPLRNHQTETVLGRTRFQGRVPTTRPLNLVQFPASPAIARFLDTRGCAHPVLLLRYGSNAGRFGPLDARQALQSPVSLLIYHKSSRIICLLLYYCSDSSTSPPRSFSPLITSVSPLWSHISSSLTVDWM